MLHSTTIRFVVLLLLFQAFVSGVRADYDSQRTAEQQQQDVRNRMNEFVDTVRHAVDDAEAASKKRDVVDLGQSLSMLEAKFSSLRSALAHELGARAPQFASNNEVAKQIMDKSSGLVQGVVSQREELRRLSSDVKEVDSAIRALREGLTTFEKDVGELHRVIADLHVSHNEMSLLHDDTKEKVKEVVADAHQMARTSTHWILYLVIILELGAFVGYMYFKKSGGTLAHKAYGKFG
ncbi:hypothetical protein FGB62_216g025 [Gracilaria domingensis]|nr:hypothetical protein FGB62_216g025 [Gracilaria domingensis]